MKVFVVMVQPYDEPVEIKGVFLEEKKARLLADTCRGEVVSCDTMDDSIDLDSTYYVYSCVFCPNDKGDRIIPRFVVSLEEKPTWVSKTATTVGSDRESYLVSFSSKEKIPTEELRSKCKELVDKYKAIH